VQHTFAIGGRTRTVTVGRDGARWRVTVDGEAHLVDCAEVDGAMLSLVVEDRTGAGRSVPVVVEPGKASGTLHVAVDGRTVPVGVVTPERSRRRASGIDDGDGPQRIVAPMPGKVVRLLVRVGDVVTPRQGLVVVEAMKMENELRAAHAGRVGSVSVVEGQSVDAGAVLAVVE
jgi:biotin carboxyl carrier protein